MTINLTPIISRFWRMLGIRWQHEPLSGAGAAQTGGRWNRAGQPALYLSADHATAILEYHQDLVRPGTLAAYEVESGAILDLTGSGAMNPADLYAEWRRIVAIDRAEPPGWRIADTAIGNGADGLLVPSVQNPGGTNLVLWRWSHTPGNGAFVRLVDPRGDLRPR